MIGPIFYILLIFLLVSVPAILGWKLSRNHGQFTRMAGTILAGQAILTPGVIYITLSKPQIAEGSHIKTMLIYACMALVISIMTFVILEMKNRPKQK